jgi:hypothetical protein
MYHGDFQKSGSIYLYFNTVGTTGEAATISSGTITAYEDGSATQFTSGITFDNDFDSVTGFHQIIIDLTDSNFEVGKTYTLVLSAGTVGALSVVGRIVGSFSVERYATAEDITGAALAEPTGVPAANATLADKISWIYMYFRNKVDTTATSRIVRADDATTAVGTEVLSDDGTTMVKGEAT